MQNSSDRKTGSNLTPLVWLAILALVGYLVLWIYGRVYPPRTIAKSACASLLYQLSQAKEQWALENKKPPGTPLSDPDQLAIKARIAHLSLKCPEGGTYSYNPVGTSPACSLAGTAPGHDLSPSPASKLFPWTSPKYPVITP